MSETSIFAVDELLRLYLKSESLAECASILDELIEKYALPVIEKCLRAKINQSAGQGFVISVSDFEDLRGESCLKLIEKLKSLRSSADTVPIRDFEGYVAVIAYNCWNEFFSNRAPNRKSLKNKIRYALGKNEAFDVWKNGGEIFCGLKKTERKLSRIAAENLTLRVREDAADFRNAALSDLLFEILEIADAHLAINDLTTIVAELWAIEDLEAVSFEDFREDKFPWMQNNFRESEMQFEIAHIWREIKDLPVNQRIALLYNLRDEKGREMLFMLFNLQVAALREIAEALNLSIEECAAILPQLPLDDKTIAEKMNLTVKQIGNLRKVARENLRRRLSGKPKRRKRENPSEKIGEKEIGEEKSGGNLREILD